MELQDIELLCVYVFLFYIFVIIFIYRVIGE